jgi:hypothetical protein
VVRWKFNTIHNIEFHTQREITRVYNSSQKSHIQLLISNDNLADMRSTNFFDTLSCYIKVLPVYDVIRP